MNLILLSLMSLLISTPTNAYKNIHPNHIAITVADDFPVPFISRKVTHDADYNTWFHYTIKNNTKKTIVAFELGAGDIDKKEHRFKQKIEPNGTYTFKIKSLHDSADTDKQTFFMALYRLKSVLFSDGSSITQATPNWVR